MNYKAPLEEMELPNREFVCTINYQGGLPMTKISAKTILKGC